MECLSGRNWKVIIGDVRDGLRTLADNSVQCCVTSPPYWGLRDYGTASWIGGDADCEHQGSDRRYTEQTAATSSAGAFSEAGESNAERLKKGRWREGGECVKCGARHIDQQIGLEPTPEDFTAAMVEVFEEVRRVLRPDGCCFINIGDSYCSTDKWGGGKSGNTGKHVVADDGEVPSWTVRERKPPVAGLKPKDLCGIPWRLAFALQSAGWWLRSEIIWHKRSPMPESVTDRPTKSHEQIFLLTKSADYFWDQEAVREKTGNECDPEVYAALLEGTGEAWYQRDTTPFNDGKKSGNKAGGIVHPSGRNIRTVWTLSAESFPGAHFATFPSSIPMRCIKAGTSERGACPVCGSPWERIVERSRKATRPGNNSKFGRASDDPDSPYHKHTNTGNSDPQRHCTVTSTAGWQPTCICNAGDPVPCIVLDPFSGSGTTGMVATELGREYIGCELNPAYAEMSRKRIGSWKHRDAEKAVQSLAGQRELFQ